MRGTHALPVRRKVLVLKLHTVLEIVGRQDAGIPVKLNSKLEHTQRVIHRMNITEDGAVGQKNEV